MGEWERLPDLAWLCVISHLEYPDVLRLSNVNRLLNAYCNMDEVWKTQLQRCFPNNDCSLDEVSASIPREHFEWLDAGAELSCSHPWTQFLVLDQQEHDDMAHRMVYSTNSMFNRTCNGVLSGQGTAAWGDFTVVCLRWGTAVAFRTHYGDGFFSVFVGQQQPSSSSSSSASNSLVLGCFRSTWNQATGTFMSEGAVPRNRPDSIDGFEWYHDFLQYHARRIEGEALFALSGRCWDVQCNSNESLCGTFVVANQASSGMVCYFQTSQPTDDLPVFQEGIAVQDHRSMIAISVGNLLWLGELEENCFKGYILQNNSKYRFIATVQE